MAFGFSGCAAMSPDPDAALENHYQVTARVVDIAPKRPGALGDLPVLPGRQSSDVPGPKPHLPRSETTPKKDPVEAIAPVPIEPERFLSDQSAEPPKTLEPPRTPEPGLNPEELFLLRVAAERPAVPLDGSINGETAVANYSSGDNQCSRVAITYPERRVSEIWRVCADRQFILERKAEPTPTVPDDPGLEATRRIAVHSAYNDGHASVPFGPFTVSAQSAGPSDARGCMLIRSALSWHGIAMATHDETICSPPDD